MIGHFFNMFYHCLLYTCTNVVPVLSTGTKIIPVLAFLIPVPVVEQEVYFPTN